MRHIISLQRECAEQFSDIYDDGDKWFAGSDPENGKVGSGGGTAWILYQAYLSYCSNLEPSINQKTETSASNSSRSTETSASDSFHSADNAPSADRNFSGNRPSFFEWLRIDRSLVLHGGGLSRRLPAYGALGKPLIPIPIFRWAQGQKLNQTLLDLQLPLLENILKLAGEGKDNKLAGEGKDIPSAKAGQHNYSRHQEKLHQERPHQDRRVNAAAASLQNPETRSLVLIASGDVLIRSEAGIDQLPEADVINFGVSIDPETAMHHGVFVCDRKDPQRMISMLQKPTLEQIQQLALDHLFFMDVGICLLSERAVRVLMKKSGWDDASGEFQGTDTAGTIDIKEGGPKPDGKDIPNDRGTPNGRGIPNYYDFYGAFGPSLGSQPTHPDPETAELTTAVVEIPGGEFYHFGRTRDVIESSLALQHRVSDQKRIWHKHVKPHPSMFIQNAIAERGLTEENRQVWIESSYIPDAWRLRHDHCLTGIPENRWEMDVPARVCINMQPVKTVDSDRRGNFAFQFYGIDDCFRGSQDDAGTVFLNMPFQEWLDNHGLDSHALDSHVLIDAGVDEGLDAGFAVRVDEGLDAGFGDTKTPHTADDIFSIPLFPIISADAVEDTWTGELLQWLITARPSAEQNRRFTDAYRKMVRCSAADLLELTDLRAQEAHRRALRARVWPLIARNYRRSVMYQVDLNHAAREFAEFGLELPPELPADEDPMILIHDAMFRDRYESWKRKLSHEFSDSARSRIIDQQGQKGHADLQGCQDQAAQSSPPGGTVYRDRAFKHLQQSILEPFRERERGVNPSITVFDDQIIWGRSPVRIDLAGGWTDTPPYSLIMGGAVVTAALELNGQPPIQVFIRKTSLSGSGSNGETGEYKCPLDTSAEHHDQPAITLRSIDLGLREEVTSFEDLEQVNLVGSAFAIPKAALTLSGFHPDYCSRPYASLADQLRQMGGGLEISFLAAIPKGSGMGTSSVLGATILGSLSEFCGLHWDYSEIGMRTLGIEQLLTTGGGWQDQYGGIIPGLKLLETGMGLDQTPKVRWLPDMLFTRREFQESLLLYYTGVTRVAKNILAEIVQGMFLNERERFAILAEMKLHARNTFDIIQLGDFEGFGRMIARSWELNKRLDSGTSSPEIEAILDKIDDLSLGYKLPGAGGGGYMFIAARNPEAARTIRERLEADPPNSRARFVDVRLSTSGLQISRS